MIRLANQLYTNYQKTALDRLCHDAVSGDSYIEEGMTTICSCFLKFIGVWEPSGKVNPDVLEAAASAHIWANIYFHIHLLNRRGRRVVQFSLIQDFKNLYAIINEDITIQDPVKRTLNQVLISQQLANIIERVEELGHAEDLPPSSEF
jgi:hypothetical protein